jgi:hypothetical protein
MYAKNVFNKISKEFTTNVVFTFLKLNTIYPAIENILNIKEIPKMIDKA